MLIYLSVAIGGAFGAMARFWVSQWFAKTFPSEIAYGTLLVNVVGSFLIGIVFVLITERIEVQAYYKPMLMTGFLGAFTTFSTFSLESLTHIMAGQYIHALAYITLSLLLCISATFLGITITRFF
ncbi:Putative fluoride ion transporter CrcB [BD1-7 clade bacterium]|uniref:Fluoride-specific ion channel FluC n=1 Tax=BD1-7 clade bacterium TaxID=2029982 RepID=A0A5S9QMQ5_9GAMM|nr:Putative fluoride ion transporter CrcB [BD1-7 clade bacterium]